MRALIFDFETYPIRPGLAFPPPVCMSSAWVVGADAQNLAVVDPRVMLWREGLALLESALQDGETLIVGANTAFDIFVSVFAHEDPERLLGLWIWAIERCRVTDVLLRQNLIDRAFGSFEKKYNLGRVAERHGFALDKSNEWRMRFGELDGLPVSAYPDSARRYSLEDSLGTAFAFIGQERSRAQGSPFFPGHDILRNQWRQQDGALALADLAGYGMRTNPRTVARFKASNEAARASLRQRLSEAGLVRLEYKRDADAIAARTADLPRTPTGKPSLAAKNLAVAADPAVRLLAQWPASAPMLVAQGLATANWHKNTDAAAQKLEAAFGAQGLTVPKTAPRRRKKTETADDYAAYLKRFEPATKLDNDACTRSLDPALELYAELSSYDTVLGSPTTMAEAAACAPFHAHYKPLQATGRTATGSDKEGKDSGGGKGNVQNMHRKPGVREQWVPRRVEYHPELCSLPGFEDRVFCDADFTSGELFTFAQLCKWLVGWSTLGDKLLTGVDVHLEIAADIEGLTYAEAKPRKKEARIAESRTGGKGINFGRKGGMGAAKFVQYAWNNYGIDLAKVYDRLVERGLMSPCPNREAAALKASQYLIDLHDARTPEFPHYSQKIQSFRRSRARDSLFDVILPGSGRCVAGLGFTDAHNYPFQGLLSDVAKQALCNVMRARWGLSELGHSDPLYRCGVVLFAHDSVTCEVAESKAEAAAKRLEQLLFRASVTVTPDYPSPAPAGIQLQLSKKAEPLVFPDFLDKEKTQPHPRAGQLTGEVWDAWEQCYRDAVALAKEGKDVAAGLAKAEWPEYCIVDTVARLQDFKSL